MKEHTDSKTEDQMWNAVKKYWIQEEKEFMKQGNNTGDNFLGAYHST